MAEVFICPEPGSGPGERFYLDVLPAAGLRAADDVIEGRVVSADALNAVRCNTVLLSEHLNGACAGDKIRQLPNFIASRQPSPGGTGG